MSIEEYMNSSQTEAHFLGAYLPWDSHENAQVAALAGMQCKLPSRANLWPHENLDNAQTGLHDYMMYRKYGYGRGCAQASVDIRSGKATRAEALAFVQDSDGVFPETYAGIRIEEVLAQIGVTRKQLNQIMDRFTNWELFRRVEDNENATPILIE